VLSLTWTRRVSAESGLSLRVGFGCWHPGIRASGYGLHRIAIGAVGPGVVSVLSGQKKSPVHDFS